MTDLSIEEQAIVTTVRDGVDRNAYRAHRRMPDHTMRHSAPSRRQ